MVFSVREANDFRVLELVRFVRRAAESKSMEVEGVFDGWKEIS